MSGILFGIASSVLCSLVLSTLGLSTIAYWVACGCAGLICGMISRNLFG